MKRTAIPQKNIKQKGANFMKTRRTITKGIISMFTAIVMLISLSPSVLASRYNNYYDTDISDYFYDELGDSFTVTASVRMKSNAARLPVMPGTSYLKESQNGRKLNDNGGYLEQFDDYRRSDYTSEENRIMKVMNAYGILEGRLDYYGNVVVDAEDDITRAEFTKVIMVSIDNYNVKINKSSSRYKNFDDVYGHWAEDYIYEATALGIIKGDNYGNFNPEDPISYEDATLIMIRIGREMKLSELQIAEGLDNLTYIDVDYYGVDEYWDFTKSTIYMTKGETFNLSSVQSGTNNTIEYKSSNNAYATVDQYGRITARKVTGDNKIYITATDDYGNNNSIRVVITDSYTEIPDPDPEPSDEFRANQSSTSVEVNGILEDLQDLFNNTSGHSLTYRIENLDPNDTTIYATINGGVVTGKKVGKTQIIATRSDGRTASILLNVFDNSYYGKGTVVPIYKNAGNNTVETVNITIDGLDSSCTVECNYPIIGKIEVSDDYTKRFVKIGGLGSFGSTDRIILTVKQDGKMIDDKGITRTYNEDTGEVIIEIDID